MSVSSETVLSDLSEGSEGFVTELDRLEERIETMRKEAAYLQEEKEILLETLHHVEQKIQNLSSQREREEADVSVDRLYRRCQSVDIRVNTPRSRHQERAYKLVTSYMEKLVSLSSNDMHTARDLVNAYLNCCTSDCIKGATDYRFQELLLGCTADDQKQVKKRLQSLKAYLDLSVAE